MASKDEYGSFSDYAQLSESVKMIFELTSRIDERVKMLIEQQNNTNDKVDKLGDKNQAFMSRVAILESKSDNGLKDEVEKMEVNLEKLQKQNEELKIRIGALEIHNNSHINKWSFIGDATFKIFMMIATAILAWSLGVNNLLK